MASDYDCAWPSHRISAVMVVLEQEDGNRIVHRSPNDCAQKLRNTSLSDYYESDRSLGLYWKI